MHNDSVNVDTAREVELLILKLMVVVNISFEKKKHAITLASRIALIDDECVQVDPQLKDRCWIID